MMPLTVETFFDGLEALDRGLHLRRRSCRRRCRAEPDLLELLLRVPHDRRRSCPSSAVSSHVASSPRVAECLRRIPSHDRARGVNGGCAQGRVLHRGALRPREIALTGAHRDGAAAAEVEHLHGALVTRVERPVAAVLDRPVGAADGRRAVAAVSCGSGPCRSRPAGGSCAWTAPSARAPAADADAVQTRKSPPIRRTSVIARARRRTRCWRWRTLNSPAWNVARWRTRGAVSDVSVTRPLRVSIVVASGTRDVVLQRDHALHAGQAEVRRAAGLQLHVRSGGRPAAAVLGALAAADGVDAVDDREVRAAAAAAGDRVGDAVAGTDDVLSAPAAQVVARGGAVEVVLAGAAVEHVAGARCR